MCDFLVCCYMQVLDKLLQKAKDEGNRVLIFSQVCLCVFVCVCVCVCVCVFMCVFVHRHVIQIV
jgi:hypothetical protein